MNERPNRGAWEKRSTYSHSRTPFSRADRKSPFPNFFLVAAWGERNKKQKEKRSKNTRTVSKNSQQGLGKERRRRWGSGGQSVMRGGERWRIKVGC